MDIKRIVREEIAKKLKEEKTENKARKQLSKSNIDDLADLILNLRDIQKSFAKNKDEGVVIKIGSATRILDSVMDTFGKYIEPSKKPIGENTINQDNKFRDYYKKIVLSIKSINNINQIESTRKLITNYKNQIADYTRNGSLESVNDFYEKEQPIKRIKELNDYLTKKEQEIKINQ